VSLPSFPLVGMKLIQRDLFRSAAFTREGTAFGLANGLRVEVYQLDSEVSSRSTFLPSLVTFLFPTMMCIANVYVHVAPHSAFVHSALVTLDR
jgi:hypothetical protein